MPKSLANFSASITLLKVNKWIAALPEKKLESLTSEEAKKLLDELKQSVNLTRLDNVVAQTVQAAALFEKREETTSLKKRKL